jgi:hypothetical protein
VARASLNQTSFTAGELSPRVLGHTDLDRYASGLKKARNCHPVITGGLKRREGSLYVANAYTAVSRESVLVPFIQGRDQAWILEFADAHVRVFNADGTDAGVLLASPYTAAMLDSIDWAQSEATMYLFHGSVPIHRLQRLGAGTWVLSEASFTTEPFAEVGWNPSSGLTLSASTVGLGRTATSGPVFRAGDIGRAIIYDAGIAVITGYTSDTQVTVEITRAFPGLTAASPLWTIEGTPQVALTPSAKDPVGASITLTSPTAIWRAADIGAMVRINGGLCRITSLTSDLIANATIVRELTSTVASPALAWTLERSVWAFEYGYPRTGTVHQQRLIAAGNVKFPRTVWGSRLAEPLDFELGTADDQAFAFTIDSDDASAISYVTAARDLVVLTESGEYSLRSGVEKPITPTNVRVVPESNHGTAQVRPSLIGTETMFIQRAGRKVRALGYRYDFDQYKSPDIATLAEHITKSGVLGMAYQQEPDLLLWAYRADGKFLTCTIDRDQQPSVIGWSLHETDGQVESLASIPNGDREQVWAIVRRTIGASSFRFIERFDGTFEALHPTTTTEGPVYGCTVDSGVVVDNASGQSVFSVPHLSGAVVEVVADGSAMGLFTATAGTVTLPRTSKRTLIGLPFSSRGELLHPEFGTGEGSAQGNAARTGEITMHFLDTIGAKVVDGDGSAQTVPFRRFGPGILDESPEPFTGLMRLSKLGWGRGSSSLAVVQDQALPMHLLAVIRKHTVNG